MKNFTSIQKQFLIFIQAKGLFGCMPKQLPNFLLEALFEEKAYMFDPDKRNKGEMEGTLEMPGLDPNDNNMKKFMRRIPPLATMAVMAILTHRAKQNQQNRNDLRLHPHQLQALVERYLMEVGIEFARRNDLKDYSLPTPQTILTEQRDKELLDQISPDILRSFAQQNQN